VIITILAAGEHSRLQAITGDTPKALYPLTPRGDNLLSYVLEGIKDWGATDILLIAGAYFEHFTRYCSLHARVKIKVVRANPNYINGPLFTFLTALPAFAEKTTVIFPADLFITPQGYRFLKNHLDKTSPCLFIHPPPANYHGPFVQNGKILPQTSPDIIADAQALLPLALVTPDFVAFSQKLSQEGVTKLINAFQVWSDRGNSLEFISIPPFFWVDIDTPEDLLFLQDYLHKNH